MPYLRWQWALVLSGPHVFTGPVAFVLCCLTPCAQDLWHELTGAHSTLTSKASGKCASLVSGHACPCPASATSDIISAPPSVCWLPLPRIHTEAQTLSSAAEAQVWKRLLGWGRFFFGSLGFLSWGMQGTWGLRMSDLLVASCVPLDLSHRTSGQYVPGILHPLKHPKSLVLGAQVWYLIPPVSLFFL